jgi:predicted XRE-type DNA-binding protein
MTAAKVTASSGNIFADIGLPNATEHELKARVVLALGRAMEARKITQTEAARRTRIAQPDLSKILRGNFSGFSLDRLLRAVADLGSDVEIRIKARHGAHDRAGNVRLVTTG